MTANLITRPGIQTRPLAITVGVHVLLILLLLLWRFSVPAREVNVPDMGMEVNLGTSPDGSGVDQPMDVEDPASSASNVSRSQQQASSSDNDVERSMDEDDPSVAEAAHRTRQRSENANSDARPGQATMQSSTRSVQPQRPRYVYPGSNGRGGNSAAVNYQGTSEGNTTGNGDRGVAGGTPGSPNYTGSPGTGTGGISYKLDGRSIVAFPPREAKFREGGRVVVRVTVNRDGEIVNRQIVSSTNTELSPIALRKLSLVRFNKSESAPAEQFGNITFEFKTRQ